MTHHDSDLSELLDALRAGEMTDTIRTSLQWIIQELIEAEATAPIGAGVYERSDQRTTQRNDTGRGCGRPRPATSSCRSPGCGTPSGRRVLR